MRNVTIRESVFEDVEAIKDRIRKHDTEEVIASGYESVADALAKSFSRSKFCYTLELEGLPVAMFGCVVEENNRQTANVWMLGTDELHGIRKTFVKMSRQVIAELLLKYSVLWNIVDSRYVMARRWLESMGAVFHNEPIVLNGVEFFGFVIRRGAC